MERVAILNLAIRHVWHVSRPQLYLLILHALARFKVVCYTFNRNEYPTRSLNAAPCGFSIDYKAEVVK